MTSRIVENKVEPPALLLLSVTNSKRPSTDGECRILLIQKRSPSVELFFAMSGEIFVRLSFASKTAALPSLFHRVCLLDAGRISLAIRKIVPIPAPLAAGTVVLQQVCCLTVPSAATRPRNTLLCGSGTHVLSDDEGPLPKALGPLPSLSSLERETVTISSLSRAIAVGHRLTA